MEGTVLHPLTKAANKRLLLFYNEPVRCSPIKTPVNAGIDEIGIDLHDHDIPYEWSRKDS
jgi:dTDP-glucose pyrophosphorylase